MRRRIGRVAAYALLVVVAAIGFVPFVVLVLLSTKSDIQILTQVPPSLQLDIDQIVKNYRDVLVTKGFLGYIRNSIVVTAITVGISLVVATPAAYAFSRLRFRGRDRWSSWILSFRFMPPIAVAIPILLMLRYIGLDDTLPGLIIPYIAFSLPLSVWILIGFFDEIPRELDDAALVDGCSRVQVLRRIVLPLVRPGLVVAAIFATIFIWNEFLVGLYIINSNSLQTVPIGAAGLISAQRPIDWSIAATVGVVTIVPIFIFSLVAQRYIARGITAGAVR
jgi:multiple sugar transport system permease protein